MNKELFDSWAEVLFKPSRGDRVSTAARMVIIDGMTQTAAAAVTGVSQPAVQKAVARILNAHDKFAKLYKNKEKTAELKKYFYIETRTHDRDDERAAQFLTFRMNASIGPEEAAARQWLNDKVSDETRQKHKLYLEFNEIDDSEIL